MEKAVNKINFNSDNALNFASNNGYIKTFFKGIENLESVGHKIILHSKDDSSIESIHFCIPFEKKLEEIFKYDRFFSPHKSYVVNMNYIKS